MEQQETKDSLDILIVGYDDSHKNNYMKLILANTPDNLIIYKDTKFYIFAKNCSELSESSVEKFDYCLFITSVIEEIPEEDYNNIIKKISNYVNSTNIINVYNDCDKMEMPLYLSNNYISTEENKNIFFPFARIIQVHTGYKGNLYELCE